MALASVTQAVMDDWMLPGTGGKRARSPVEKLADLQQGGHADDEANWRSSKRYFTEVISNGFSKLTFGRGLQPGQSVEQHMLQPQNSCSCHLELPGNTVMATDESDCEMEVLKSPTWPPQSSSPCSNGNRIPKASSLLDATAGILSTQGMTGHSAVQHPLGSYSVPAIRGHTNVGSAPGQPPTVTTTVAVSPVLAPKLLKAVEKAPNSPSDMPAVGSSLRKVALLRALLVRTEQHLQHQHAIEQPVTHQHLQTDRSDANVQQQQQQHQQQQQVGLLMQASSTVPTMNRIVDSAQTETHICQAVDQQETVSDDMDCSSTSMEECPNTAVNAMNLLLPGTLHCSSSNSLLCGEVLSSSAHVPQHCHHQQHWSGPNVQQKPSTAAQELYASQPSDVSGSESLSVPQCSQPCQQQQQLSAAHQQQPLNWCMPQPQGRSQHHDTAPPLHFPPRSRLKSPEISIDRLEALRAKAIASTATLADLEPEDLHSLQLSITASQCRRGSEHAHMHSTLAPATATARRHSSHI